MTKNERIFLSSPHMSGLERQYIDQAFATNWIAPLGPNVDAFEHELAAFVGMKGAAALSSGTAAIHLALRLLDVRQGDMVFCSSLTFAASANPILYQGAQPVFIDSEPSSWNMSPQALETAFHELKANGELAKVKAVIVVNLYGQSADMDPIIQLCNQYHVPIVEDAAESLGATYKEKASGTFGKFGVYSFNGNKIITTSGGGMLVSDDLQALEKARKWATQSRDKALHYQHSEIGYNYRMSNVLAGIGRGQLQVLEERVNARRMVCKRYQEAFAKTPWISVMPEAEFGRSNRWLTVLTLDTDAIQVTIPDICHALGELEIEARPVWKPLHRQPLFKGTRYYPHEASGKGTYKGSVSEQLYASGICLPSGSNMTEDQQQRVIEALLNSVT